MEQSKNPEKFNMLKERIEKKNKVLGELYKSITFLKKDLEIDKKELYSICEHKYVKECISDSCYREYAYICKYCGKF